MKTHRRLRPRERKQLKHARRVQRVIDAMVDGLWFLSFVVHCDRASERCARGECGK